MMDGSFTMASIIERPLIHPTISVPESSFKDLRPTTFCTISVSNDSPIDLRRKEFSPWSIEARDVNSPIALPALASRQADAWERCSTEPNRKFRLPNDHCEMELEQRSFLVQIPWASNAATRPIDSKHYAMSFAQTNHSKCPPLYEGWATSWEPSWQKRLKGKKRWTIENQTSLPKRQQPGPEWTQYCRSLRFAKQSGREWPISRRKKELSSCTWKVSWTASNYLEQLDIKCRAKLWLGGNHSLSLGFNQLLHLGLW